MQRDIVGSMTALSETTYWRVRLDDRRRPTLPPELLAAAGIPTGAELNARVASDGVIVLETRDAVLARIREHMAPLMGSGSEVDAFLADRREQAERENA
jgi:hypothetical protein